MITGVSIENFKGIRERVELELRPLTLLFGANSAGKSSILHAMQYAAEVFERRNLDAGLMGEGAAGVDLGGYLNFVHGHNVNVDVTLGFRFGLPATDGFPSFRGYTPQDVDEPCSLYGSPKSAYVSLTIGWSSLHLAPVVRRYAVRIDDVELAEIASEPGSRGCVLLFNELHPSFTRTAEHSALDLWIPEEQYESGDEPVIRTLLQLALHLDAISGTRPLPNRPETNLPHPYTVRFAIDSKFDALPDFDAAIRFDGIDWSILAEPYKSARIPDLAAYLTEAISQVVIGPGRLLRDLLVKSRFLGPIREVPSRNHSPSRQQERARWSSGLGAWDRLATANASFVDAVSAWLGDETRLNSGYRLRLKHFKELDLANPLVLQLLNGSAFDDAEIGAKLDLGSLPTQTRVLIVPLDGSVELRPSDVGIGISQVVPVIVTALDGAGRTIVVEQPELHLHPKLQAEIADLFIEAAKGSAEHVVVLETHSELIPLRIMRRIRETFEKRKTERLAVAEEDVAIYYVEPYEGATVVTRLNLSEQGQLLDPWPEGFFEEGYRERFAD